MEEENDKFKGYRGSSNLKRSNVKINWTPDKIQEFMKCSQDPIYFAEHHMKIVNVDRGLLTISLYKYQKEIIRTALEHRWTVAECARQSGKTTAVTVFVLWYILFNPNKTVAILANKAETAREILSRIQLAYEHLPKWLQQGVIEWNKGSFELENGSRVLAAATTSSNIRGYAINMLIIDEAAFIEGWEDFFTSVYPTITSGESTKLILISTVNGLNHFEQITTNARKGRNNYKLISVTWRDVPGRNKKWQMETLAAMNFDKEKFAQEYENRYLGSSGTLIAGWKLTQLREQQELPLIQQEGISLYSKPDKTKTYIGVVDVSRGKLLDYSTLQVIDVTAMPYKQVLVFRSNTITPADFAGTINRIGRQYNDCAMLIEINDIGQQTADVLHYDFEYPNVLITESAGRMGKRITSAFDHARTDRGIRTTKTVKLAGCSMLKLLIEGDQLIVYDHNTIHELSTFSRKTDSKTSSYEAEPPNHDDLVMPLVLFAWLTETDYFKEMHDVNTLATLRDNTDSAIDAQLMPFGFFNDGVDDDTDGPVRTNSDLWFHVSDDRFRFS